MNIADHRTESAWFVRPTQAVWHSFFAPVCEFDCKVKPQDFCVREIMGFTITGSGEHAVFEVTKSDCTTQDVIRYLSTRFGVPQKDIGYAGLKDKVAVTTQWISLPLPAGTDPAQADEHSDSMHIRFLGRHRQKLRPGCHQANAFMILLRNVVGDREAIEARLHQLRQGFPNTFGPQRFGRGFSNLYHFERWKQGKRLGRQARQMAISSVRSMGFNNAISDRWLSLGLRKVYGDDRLMWRGSRSIYVSTGEALDQQRLDEAEVDIACPLVDETVLWEYGKKQGHWPSWSYIMTHCLDHVSEWRRAWVAPQDFSWQWEGPHVALSFQLEKGSFATSLLSSLGALRQADLIENVMLKDDES